METVTKNNISKKSLKVAVNEPTQNISLSVNEPVKEIQETNDEQGLEASKTNVKLTKKGKVDARVEIGKKNPNLALGRQKLAEVWAEKRRIKDELMQKAVEKKLLLALKQKEQINKSFGIAEEINSDSDKDENENNEIVEQLTKKQIIKTAPKKVVKEPVQVISKPPKEKKKIIRYVEESSSEEEEEIVYVPKRKPKTVYVEAPYQQQQPVIQKPNIVFW